jgi:hypothetical protein
MPSWHAQHVFFFYAMVITYLVLQRKHISATNLMILNSVPALVCTSRLTLGFNTFPELMIGNIIGVTFGFIYQYSLFKWIKPRVNKILAHPFVRWLGYRDHFFYLDDNGDPYEWDSSSVKQKKEDDMLSKDTCLYCQLGTPHQTHY